MLPKVPKQANFRRSVQYSQAEIEWCAKFLALCCDKIMQDRELISGSKVPYPISSKHKFPTPLKKLILNFCTSKILILTFCKCAKNDLRHKKFLNKGQIWKQHFQISLKSLKNLVRKLFHKVFFSKIGPFYISAG